MNHKKLLNAFLTAVFAAAAIFLPSPAVSAADHVTNSYITLNKPVHKDIYYKGETFPILFIMTNPWSAYKCNVVARVIRADNNVTAWEGSGGYIDPNYTMDMSGDFTTAELPVGDYYFDAVAVACDSQEQKISSVSEEYARNLITIKKLQAPSSVTVTPGTNSATITYAAAEGAQKYQIYRSESKSSGFSLVATTASLKYVDKTVKTAKRYYYKIKSQRSAYGTITSGFSSVVEKEAVSASSSIKLNKSAVSVSVGSSVTLKATVKGPSSSVTWTSSNKTVATVTASGKVTGKKAGTAKITAKANGRTATCKVTVTAAPAWATVYQKHLTKYYKNSSKHFSLIYIDNNSVPELMISEGTAGTSDVLVATYNSTSKSVVVQKLPDSYGRLMYKKKSGRFCVSRKLNVESKNLYVFKLSANKFSSVSAMVYTYTSPAQISVDRKKVSASAFNTAYNSAVKNMKTVAYGNCYPCTASYINKIVSSPGSVTR